MTNPRRPLRDVVPLVPVDPAIARELGLLPSPEYWFFQIPQAAHAMGQLRCALCGNLANYLQLTDPDAPDGVGRCLKHARDF